MAEFDITRVNELVMEAQTTEQDNFDGVLRKCKTAIEADILGLIHMLWHQSNMTDDEVVNVSGFIKSLQNKLTTSEALLLEWLDVITETA